MKAAFHFRVTLLRVDLIHEVTFPFAVSYKYRWSLLAKLLVEELNAL